MIPVALPILLFCRKTELIMDRESRNMEQAAWAATTDEIHILERMINDVKIIGNFLLRYFHKLSLQRLSLRSLVKW